MDIYQAIKARTSIRKYKDRGIEDDKLNRVLDAARLAPSGKNGQPWTYIVVTDPDIRKKLVPACKGQQFVGEAPVVIVACGDESSAYQKMGGYWNSLPVDIGISLEHLMLAATAEGLGTCWIGAFLEEDVKSILDIPEDIKVVAITPLGYPDREISPTPRKELREILMRNKWGSGW